MKNPLKSKNSAVAAAAPNAAAALEADMVHARLGVLYVFSRTYANPGFSRILISGSSSLVGGVLQGAGTMTETPAASYTGTGVKAGGFALNEISKLLENRVQPKSETKAQSAETKPLFDRLCAFFKMVAERVSSMYQGLKVNPWAWGAGIKTIIHAVVSYIVDTAIPLGGVFDVVRGTTQAAVAGFHRIMSWLETKSVSLAGGHTGAIIEAVQSAMNRSVGEGLWIAAKGGAQIGLDVTLAGIGTLAKAIASGLEMVVKYAMRMAECNIVEKFRKDAAAAWATRETARWHEDADRFNTWFRDYALAVPALGAVAMNCGYCGSPMQYLNMYTKGGSAISQGQFDAGMGMLTRLKRYSKDYLNMTGALGFGSPDRTVHGALEAARFYGGTPRIHGNKRHLAQNNASDVVYGILTG